MQVGISTGFDVRKEKADIENVYELCISKKNGKIKQKLKKAHEKGLTMR